MGLYIALLSIAIPVIGSIYLNKIGSDLEDELTKIYDDLPGKDMERAFDEMVSEKSFAKQRGIDYIMNRLDYEFTNIQHEILAIRVINNQISHENIAQLENIILKKNNNYSELLLKNKIQKGDLHSINHAINENLDKFFEEIKSLLTNTTEFEKFVDFISENKFFEEFEKLVNYKGFVETLDKFSIPIIISHDYLKYFKKSPTLKQKVKEYFLSEKPMYAYYVTNNKEDKFLFELLVNDPEIVNSLEEDNIISLFYPPRGTNTGKLPPIDNKYLSGTLLIQKMKEVALRKGLELNC